MWIVGLAAVFATFGALAQAVVNVVTYQVGPAEPVPSWWLGYWAPLCGVVAVLLLAVWRAARPTVPGLAAPGESGQERCGTGIQAPAETQAGSLCHNPLLVTVAVVATWLCGTSFTFLMVCLALAGFVWSIDRWGRDVALPPSWRLADRYAPGVLALAVLVSTVWHTVEQVHLWRHFMLGYADFGFFTTELEHCLPWKDVGPERFSDTRMGYHCIWMFYALVPLYAVVRSPVFLMFVGPAALNLAAIPFYRLAKERTGSGTVAMLIGLAWLALPSVSRLPYANTYGFQSIYLAVPWLAGAFTLGVQGRWGWSHACLAAALLCEETVCSVAFGWGLYLVLWGGRRRDGLWIAGLALLYLAVCTGVVIPFFAGAAHYTRWALFGEVTAHNLIQHLLRPRVGLYLLALSIPLVPGLFRGAKVLVAAAPTLLLVILLQEEDYLNIKYWHQSSALPVLFLAATIGVTALGPRASRDPAGSPWQKLWHRLPACVSAGAWMPVPHRSWPLSPEARRGLIGPALALWVGVLLFHQVMGASPLARSHQFSALRRAFPDDDRRRAAVSYVRAHFPPERTTVIATERLAAHFTDYRMVRPARAVPGQGPTGRACVWVVDREDRWDPVVRAQRMDVLLAEARAAGLTVIHEEGPVLILALDEADTNGPAER
ncbi:MAG: DUF2079 domain-containing protein [Planctomycetota bacterium]